MLRYVGVCRTTLAGRSPRLQLPTKIRRFWDCPFTLSSRM